MQDWNSVIYPQQKVICYITSSVFLYYVLAIIILVICWPFINKRLVGFSIAVLLLGFLNFSFVQIICYVDYLVDFSRCTVYTRLTTILADLQHLVFDIYQMRKILPLLGSVVRNSYPLAILSWAFFIVRIGAFCAKSILQTVFVAPPVGGFIEVGKGICGNTINSVALVLIRVSSFSFEFLLFGELLYIIYRLKTDSRADDESRASAATSIERMLDCELFIFAIYFLMDLLFLVMLIVPNSGFQYGIFGTIYNAILPTVIIANSLCSKFLIQRYNTSIESYPQSQNEWQGYFRSKHLLQRNSLTNPSPNPALNLNIDMFKPKKEFEYSRDLETSAIIEPKIVARLPDNETPT